MSTDSRPALEHTTGTPTQTASLPNRSGRSKRVINRLQPNCSARANTAGRSGSRDKATSTRGGGSICESKPWPMGTRFGASLSGMGGVPVCDPLTEKTGVNPQGERTTCLGRCGVASGGRSTGWGKPKERVGDVMPFSGWPR